MYLPDLAPYTYNNAKDDGKTVAIGWLGDEQKFDQGSVPQELVDKLNKIEPSRQTRGFHVCPLCTSDPATGSSEIRVLGLNGKIYAAPSMLIHYITCHNYLPPQEFIDALNALK